MFTTKSSCRYCGGELVPVAKIKSPAPNIFYSSQMLAKNAPVHDLPLSQCKQCAALSVPVVQSKEELFETYTFRSGVTHTFREHCKAFAESLARRRVRSKSERSVVIDIAGNDGTLALAISEACDLMPLVIDPAKNILPHAQSNRCAILSKFWSYKTAEEWRETEKSINRFVEGAEIITATNVLAHVDDPVDFIAGVKYALAPDGLFVVEFPYARDFFCEVQWDTVYPEHLGYLTFSAVHALLSKNNLSVIDVERVAIHGGSLRVYAMHSECENAMSHEIIAGLSDAEKELSTPEKREYFERTMADDIKRLQFYVNSCGADAIAGFGAAAKSSVINTMSGFTPKFIIDETPEKIGKFQGVSGVPIVSLSYAKPALKMGLVKTVFNYAWNYRDEAHKKLRDAGFLGNIIDITTGRV